MNISKFLLSFSVMILWFLTIGPAETHAQVVSGNVFIDTNKNNKKDAGEQNYSGTPINGAAGSSSCGGTSGTSSMSYTNQTKAPGIFQITISAINNGQCLYIAVPNGYTALFPSTVNYAFVGPRMTYRVEFNGGCNVTVTPTPPQLQCNNGNLSNLNFAIIPIPTATPLPSPTPTPTPIGNITDLNFGISNSYPWIQTICGDFRMDRGIDNRVPLGQFALVTNTTCSSPGLAFTGDVSAKFSPGQASSTNQVVGGSTYPEVYVPPNVGGIFSSYDYLSQKTESANLQTTDLATICPTLTNCTLSGNLPNGIYTAAGDVSLNAYTFPNNRDYVFLIDGDLTVNGNIIVPANSNSTALFSSSGDIIIPATVGNPVSVTDANLSGIFSTDQSFVMQTNGNCTDLRFNMEGTLIVNAGRSGGSLQNNRDLCASNPTTPALQLTQRLDFILNLPEFLRIQTVTIEETAP